MQDLWLAKVTWDEPLPKGIQKSWSNFKRELSKLNEIQIPRLVLSPQSELFELHVFADASEKAYGACAYIRSKSTINGGASHLLAAKSRVAPLKQITLPRLELCAALTAAKLSKTILDSINVSFSKVCLWSDSTIALCWIAGEPGRWKTFVSNRVSEIQRLCKDATWHHIESKTNPADLLSRGTGVEQLQTSDLWFHGPPQLRNPNFNATKPTCQVNDSQNVPEQRKIKSLSFAAVTNFDLFQRYSSANKLIRVMAYALRFISSLKRTTTESRSSYNLSASELEESQNRLLKLAQQISFHSEYQVLASEGEVSKKSKLHCLDPFLDSNGLIRVGGRLQNVNSEFDKRHPIILDQKHPFTRLLLIREHDRLMHCGPTMLLASIREKYWPISGRKLARSVVKSCVKCFRACPPVPPHASMGNLPAGRVNESVPFFNTGCDFAGPFLLRDRNTRCARGSKLIKGYICLFICLSTKAIHLEVVTELSTEAFIAALRRFMGRRGKPKNIHSDNGTNFRGADTYLRELYAFLNSNQDMLNEQLAQDNIVWHFIPARAPNFGGIWEANIKRVKFHLTRVVGEAHLSLEDFNTVLIQIEAILNSTPICPLSSSPDQLNPLTPAHFLLGKPLTTLPDKNYTQIKDSYLKRYERLQAMVQHFWKRWHKEYLGELQTRAKWNKKIPNILKEGMVVLMEDENAPPLQWKMGRIAQLHPGKDDIVRVVTIFTNNKLLQRPVSKVRVFPFELQNNLS